MDDMDKKEIKEVIEWCDEKGHSEHEILELIRRIVGAKPRNEEESDKQAFGKTERAADLPKPPNPLKRLYNIWQEKERGNNGKTY